MDKLRCWINPAYPYRFTSRVLNGFIPREEAMVQKNRTG